MKYYDIATTKEFTDNFVASKTVAQSFVASFEKQMEDFNEEETKVNEENE